MVDQYEWRFPARVVAYVDMVLSILALIVVVLLIVFMGLGSIVTVANKDEIKDQTDLSGHEITALMIVMWICLAIFAVTTVIELWAAVMLVKATAPGAEVNESLRRAIIWRNVAIAFFIMWAVVNITSYNWISFAVGALIRIGIIFVVWKFIGELRVEARGDVEARAEHQKF